MKLLQEQSQTVFSAMDEMEEKDSISSSLIKFAVKTEEAKIDDEVLVNEVVDFPFIYDNRSPDYRNLIKRQKTWNYIADKVGTNSEYSDNPETSSWLTKTLPNFSDGLSEALENYPRTILATIQTILRDRRQACLEALRYSRIPQPAHESLETKARTNRRRWIRHLQGRRLWRGTINSFGEAAQKSVR